MKITKQSKLKNYSLVAVGIIAGGNATQAAIQYTNIDPDTVVSSEAGYEKYDLYFNNDAISDMTLFWNSRTSGFYSSASSWHISDNSYMKLNFQNSNRVVALINGSSFQPISVNSGSVISGDLNDWISSNANGNLASHIFRSWNFTSGSGTYSNTKGDYFLNDTSYIGVEFRIDSKIHYGWIQIQMADTVGGATILDFAYEDQEGVGIAAGDKGGSAGIEDRSQKNTVHSYGRDVHINTTSKGTATVYNLAGQEVASQTLKGGANRLNVKGDVGIYVVRITQNGNTENHRVYLS